MNAPGPANSPPLRVVFFGTAEFACPALVELEKQENLKLLGVVTQPDRPAGRGLQPKPPPVKEVALQLKLPVWQPDRCRDETFLRQMRELAPELIVVAAYGQILPKALLELPRHGCLNIHGSLLPKYRGAAPIQRAIAEGEEETGVTIMLMDEGLDTGPILAQEATRIWPDDNAQTLHDRLALMGAHLLVDILPDYLAGKLLPRPQPSEGATYAAKVTRADGEIDWRRSAVEVDRQIRAFTPWPGATTRLPFKERPRLKILEAEPLEREGGEPGVVLASGPETLLVACGRGVLQIHRLQREGGKPLPAAEFLRGCPLPPGTRLG
ncbi:MAG: methionyl-tRNA formyltransferase [Verrucomicrobia bacterium]|nr:MAG: methionyl-tRNA formyltransferase [Verrucomicrobiota bacterium]